MSAIFISHSSKDHAVASELQARLSEQGLWSDDGWIELNRT
jgi:hypothetical protein